MCALCRVIYVIRFIPFLSHTSHKSYLDELETARVCRVRLYSYTRFFFAEDISLPLGMGGPLLPASPPTNERWATEAGSMPSSPW